MLAQQRQIYLRGYRLVTGNGGKRFNFSKPRLGMLKPCVDQQLPPLTFAASALEEWTVGPKAVDVTRPSDMMPETRSHFGVAAADDFVNDYRELACLPIWDNLLESNSDDFRVLDVCCGTGRWAQAFSELVVKERQVPCDFIDLCSDSMNVLGERLNGISNLSGRTRFHGDICDLSNLGVPQLSYDAITNMHGLYGVPTAILPAGLQAMHDALKLGGTMVIAIGADNSPYQQVPKQCLGKPVTNDIDIVQALHSLGIQTSISHIMYHEEYEATDQAGLERFLLEECGGNCFPTDVAKNLEFSIQEYADSCFDQLTRKYRFHHEIAIITVQRSALDSNGSNGNRETKY